MAPAKLDVTVTTRAAEDNVLWLLNHLRSHPYRGLLGTITYLPITNNNQNEWRSQIGNHSFAILYHTKRHGRINITDVPDSLYDRELQELSEVLGRDNVIVTVDDLLSSDDEEKRRILETQPSIFHWAGQLLLFTETEKDPVPQHKQQVLLHSFQAAQRKKQKSSISWKAIPVIMAGMLIVFVLGRRFYRRKRLF